MQVRVTITPSLNLKASEYQCTSFLMFLSYARDNSLKKQLAKARDDKALKPACLLCCFAWFPFIYVLPRNDIFNSYITSAEV